jgi:hypothetical protein
MAVHQVRSECPGAEREHPHGHWEADVIYKRPRRQGQHAADMTAPKLSASFSTGSEVRVL